MANRITFASTTRELCRATVTSYRDGQYQDALRALSILINSHVYVADEAYNYRSNILEKLGREEEALIDACTFYRRCPDNREAFVRVGELAIKISRIDVEAVIRTALQKMGILSQPSTNQVNYTYTPVWRARACYIDKLPFELLGKIILEWMQLDKSAPVVASHVSRSWRTTAISTQAMWTSLTVGSTTPDSKRAAWTERCNGRFRELVFRDDYASHCEIPHLPSVSWLPDMTATASETLTLLDLDVVPVMREFVFDTLCTKPDLPLRSLVVQSSKNQDDRVVAEAFCEAFTIPHNFTQLESLTVHQYRLAGSFSFPHLKKLDYRPSHPFNSVALDCLEWLRTLSELEELHLREPSGRLVSVTSLEPLILPNLAFLELEGSADWYGFLGVVATPSLQTFEIKSCIMAYVNFVLSRLADNNAPLVNLVIKSCMFNEQALSTELARFALLSSLEVSHSLSLSSLVETLAYSPDQWPKLVHVNFSHCQTLSGEALVRLVYNRLHHEGDQVDQAVAQLPTEIIAVNIDGCRDVTRDVVSQLRDVVWCLSCETE